MSEEYQIQESEWAVYCNDCGKFIMAAQTEEQYIIASKLLICHECAMLRTQAVKKFMPRRFIRRKKRDTPFKRGYQKGWLNGYRYAISLGITEMPDKDSFQDARMSADRYWTLACESCSNNTKPERNHLCEKCRRRTKMAPTNWIPIAGGAYKRRSR